MEDDQKAPRRILPKRDTRARTGLSGAQMWREEKAGRFPVRVQLTPYRVGYFEDEVEAWIASRPRGGSITTPKSPGRPPKADKAAA